MRLPLLLLLLAVDFFRRRHCRAPTLFSAIKFSSKEDSISRCSFSSGPSISYKKSRFGAAVILKNGETSLSLPPLLRLPLAVVVLVLLLLLPLPKPMLLLLLLLLLPGL